MVRILRILYTMLNDFPTSHGSPPVSLRTFTGKVSRTFVGIRPSEYLQKAKTRLFGYVYVLLCKKNLISYVKVLNFTHHK